jgi:hypothetical protein
VLADVREFLMVTWIAQRAGESQKLADEVAMRIESLRTGVSRRSWHPALRFYAGMGDGDDEGAAKAVARGCTPRDWSR